MRLLYIIDVTAAPAMRLSLLRKISARDISQAGAKLRVYRYASTCTNNRSFTGKRIFQDDQEDK